MQISEKIEYFTNNMTLKFALANIGKIEILRNEIKRYLDREIKNKSKMPLQFTSQSIRSLTVQLEKMQKLSNKKISFREAEDRLYKRVRKLKPELLATTDEKKRGKLRKQAYTDETNFLVQYMTLSRELQKMVSCFNYFALDTLLLERIARQEKEEDDKILREELEFIMFDLMKNEDPMI